MQHTHTSQAHALCSGSRTVNVIFYTYIKQLVSNFDPQNGEKNQAIFWAGIDLKLLVKKITVQKIFK